MHNKNVHRLGCYSDSVRSESCTGAIIVLAFSRIKMLWKSGATFELSIAIKKSLSAWAMNRCVSVCAHRKDAHLMRGQAGLIKLLFDLYLMVYKGSFTKVFVVRLGHLVTKEFWCMVLFALLIGNILLWPINWMPSIQN